MNKVRIDITKKVNVHGDHVATCLCCIHANIDSGLPGYSEMTPGSPARCECDKGHWGADSFDENLAKVMHESAKACKDYKGRS